MPSLIEKLTKKEHNLPDKEKVLVGRSKKCDIQLLDKDRTVSREHAEINKKEGNYYIIDLNSTNRTYVNDVEISEVVLSNNDEIKFGEYETIFKQED